MQWGPSWLLRGMHDSLADAAETLVKELMSLPMSSPAVSVHQQLPPPVIAPALSGAATDVPAPDANLLALVATAASQIMVPVAAPKPADQPDAPPGSPQATTAAEFIGPFLPAEPMTGVVSTPVKSPCTLLSLSPTVDGGFFFSFLICNGSRLAATTNRLGGAQADHRGAYRNAPDRDSLGFSCRPTCKGLHDPSRLVHQMSHRVRAARGRPDHGEFFFFLGTIAKLNYIFFA